MLTLYTIHQRIGVIAMHVALIENYRSTTMAGKLSEQPFYSEWKGAGFESIETVPENTDPQLSYVQMQMFNWVPDRPAWIALSRDEWEHLGFETKAVKPQYKYANGEERWTNSEVQPITHITHGVSAMNSKQVTQ